MRREGYFDLKDTLLDLLQTTHVTFVPEHSLQNMEYFFTAFIQEGSSASINIRDTVVSNYDRFQRESGYDDCCFLNIHDMWYDDKFVGFIENTLCFDVPHWLRKADIRKYPPEILRSTFAANYDRNGLLYRQYFASFEGILTRFPSVMAGASTSRKYCYFTDSRFKEWFTSAATTPKDVVIIILADESKKLLVAKIVAKLLIRMSNLQDNVR